MMKMAGLDIVIIDNHVNVIRDDSSPFHLVPQTMQSG